MIPTKRHIAQWLQKPVPIAPLITFRILFGSLMMIGAIRFVYYGWVERLYVAPSFFFKFYGFHWVQTPDQTGLYFLFGLLILSALFIALGFFYRLATLVFFCSFTYVELLDATNYLNHYYLVCLLAFLLFFLPANRAFSIDTWRKPVLKVAQVPAWTINILIFQLSLVYCCAGIAKLNSDWLLRAMPMSVWLLERSDMPVLGYFFQFKWTAYIFSWAGALYDLSIAFFLLWPRSRVIAYGFVIIFHLLTKLLFNIGLFPMIMITSTLIFFSAPFHERLLGFMGYKAAKKGIFVYPPIPQQILRPVLAIYIVLQILLPFRHIAYPGNLLWTEEAYRFSWRVMLVEKIGHATFYIEDRASDKKTEIINSHFLSSYQEKQMAIQPDFILQFAHFLKKEYSQRHQYQDPIVRVEAQVALNGRRSHRLIDPQVDLGREKDSLWPKNWILSFKN